MKEKLEIALSVYKKLLDVSKKCADSGDSSKIREMCARESAKRGLCHFMYMRFELRIYSYFDIDELMQVGIEAYIDDCPFECGEGETAIDKVNRVIGNSLI